MATNLKAVASALFIILVACKYGDDGVALSCRTPELLRHAHNERAIERGIKRASDRVDIVDDRDIDQVSDRASDRASD